MKAAVNISCADRVKQYPKGTLHADGGLLFCSSCNVTLDHTRKGTIDKHLGSKTHVAIIGRRKEEPEKVTQKQISVATAFQKGTAARDARNVAQFELVEAFAAANIPMTKLDHPKIREYLCKNVANLGQLPQSTTLRRQILPKVFEVAEQEIRERVSAATSITVVTDEASDSQDRYVLHIVFILPVKSGNQRQMEAVTADLVYLEQVNSTTVSRALVKTLSKFNIDFDKVSAILTDNATYMSKTMASIKVLLPYSVHLTCNAHILSLVGETFRKNFPLVDRLVACFKAIFVHCAARKHRYKELIALDCGMESTQVSLPPVPVVTRWNSWFKAVSHHAKYIDHYQHFIEAELEMSAPSNALLELIELLKSKAIKADVRFIAMNTSKLMNLLTWFESRHVLIHLAYNKIMDLMAGMDTFLLLL